jgi:DNA mismatch repair protein MutL
MIIDQKRAHERILYEKYLRSMDGKFGVAQQNLFPQTFQLSASDHTVLLEILEDICSLGFDIRDLGNHTIVVNGYPSNAASTDPKEMVELLLEEYKSTGTNVKEGTKDRVCKSLAKASAIPYGKSLSREEIQELIDALFACDNPNYSPSGKPVLTILEMNDIEDHLKT